MGLALKMVDVLLLFVCKQCNVSKCVGLSEVENSVVGVVTVGSVRVSYDGDHTTPVTLLHIPLISHIMDHQLTIN